MRMRVGLAIGLAAGYYLGARAGRERYEDLHALLERMRRSDALEVAADKARAVVDLGLERARDLVESTVANGSTAEPGPLLR